MIYAYRERKTVTVLCEKLEVATAFNVLGHLAQAIGAHADSELMGRLYLKDRSGTQHLGIGRYGFIILKANASKIREAIVKGRAVPNLLMVDFPRQMLDTRHDDELNNWLLEAEESSLEYLGVAFHGKTEDIDAICRKFSLWR
jgi:hypothetical protein